MTVTPPNSCPLVLITVWDAVCLLWAYHVSYPPGATTLEDQHQHLVKMLEALADIIRSMEPNWRNRPKTVNLTYTTRWADCSSHVRRDDLAGANIDDKSTTGGDPIEATNEDAAVCTNQAVYSSLRTSLGELRRVGSLGVDSWTTGTGSRPCRRVYPHYLDLSSTSGDGTLRSVPRGPQTDETGWSREHHNLLVDTLANDLDRYRVASFIGRDLYSEALAPEILVENMVAVRDFGFNHIIVIGEILYGMVFLDCYGRVFVWDYMTWALWPCGNSLEEAKAICKQSKRMAWTLDEDGKIHEYEYDFLSF